MLLSLSTIFLLIWHSRWVHPKLAWSRNDVGFPKSTSVMSISHSGSIFCFFPVIFISSTYTDKNSPFSRLTNKHSQFVTFSQPYFNRTFSNCLSHNSPAKGWPYRFRSRRTTWTSILDHDSGQLCFHRRTQISGHSDFGIFLQWWCIFHFALGLSWYCVCCLSCASWQSGDDIHDFGCCHLRCWWSFSVNTAYEPESSFTMSPRSTTLPLYFWYWGSSSEFSRWQRSIYDAKWSFLPLFLASPITSLLFLTFLSCHVGILSSFSSSFSTAALHLVFSLLEAQE